MTLERLYRAYNSHDLEAVSGLYAPGGTHEDVAMDRVASGASEIADGLGRFWSAFPDAHWDTEQTWERGNRAVRVYVLTGTLRGQLGPFTAYGQRIRLPGVHVIETDRDGRVVNSVDYWDLEVLAQQLRPPVEAVQLTDEPVAGSDGGTLVSAEAFRQAMRLLAGGVAVVTTVVEGRPWGLTVSACCSLTADPPQMLVSLDSRTASCRAIVEGGSFGVNMLGSDQIEIAQQCSARGRPKFIEELVDAGSAQARSPVIAGSLIHVDCELVDSHRVGDHMLLIGFVRAVLSPRTHGEMEPLVYFERAFRSVGAALT